MLEALHHMLGIRSHALSCNLFSHETIAGRGSSKTMLCFVKSSTHVKVVPDVLVARKKSRAISMSDL
jgi:hypothetical protein